MTRMFSINDNNDLFAVGGALQISTGITAVLQNCERAVKALRGEMIYAANRGVDYFNDAWSGSPNVIRFEAGARAQIARVAGVVSVAEFNAEVRGNTLFYTATIQTEFGTDTINGQL